MLIAEMSAENLAWVSGLFEGEGSVNGSSGLAVHIKMTDLDVLERAQRITGVGKVYGPYQSKYPGSKPHWSWSVQAQMDAYVLLQRMWPWLCQRRREQVIDKVLSRRLRPLKEARHG